MTLLLHSVLWPLGPHRRVCVFVVRYEVHGLPPMGLALGVGLPERDREGLEQGDAVRSLILARFLIERASASLELANYLFWYLRVELDDSSSG
jgi:hypothetical protein